ncbi:hypothetical protein BJ742DRAFT_767925 [Cladochytrium replicatum]|nr:hypothetical protein BJ742DRAFT_767925 [Cladochytrium replicatum]
MFRLSLLVLYFFVAAVYARSCIQVPSSNDQFCITATQLNATAVRIVYTAPPNIGWVAFGPGSSMSSADVVIAWPNNDGTVTVSRRLVSGYSLPRHMPGTISIVSAQTKVMNLNGTQKMVATFDRTYAQLSGLPASLAFQGVDQKQAYIYAMNPTERPTSSNPSSSISKHPSFARQALSGLTLLSSSGASADSDIGGGGANTMLLVAHGWLMALAWGVFAPSAVIVARYFKPKLGVWWFRIHYILFTLVVLFTFIALGLIYVYTESSGGEQFSVSDPLKGTHVVLGMLLICAAPLQAVLGIVIDKLFDPARSAIPIRDKIHWWVGRSALLLGFAVVVPIGLALYSSYFDSSASSLGKISGVVYGLWALMVVIGVGACEYVFGQQHHSDTKYQSVPAPSFNENSKKMLPKYSGF